MLAARISGDLSLKVEETPIRDPARGEVLVRVHAAGVCGTDLHILDGMIRPDVYPMTLGHEAAGVVEAVGADVDVSIGQRVALYNKIFCGACEQCLNGRQNICDREQGQLGFNRDGGDAEFALLPASNVVVLPESVDFATGAVLTCAGMTAMHAARMSNLRIGETAVVNGIGGVGLMVLQTAVRAGARVIGVADSEEKLALARDHGAHEGLLISEKEPFAMLATRVRELTDGRGCDVFFELVGTTESMSAGVRSLAKRGRFVSTGYTTEDLHIHPIEFILSETTLVSTVAAGRQDLEDAVRLAASGDLLVPISARFPLQGVGEALEALRNRRVLGRQVLELT